MKVVLDQIKRLHHMDLQYLKIGQLDHGLVHTISHYVNSVHTKFSSVRI